jgi:two-component system, chemotaxis family, sensor kinase CheA
MDGPEARLAIMKKKVDDETKEIIVSFIAEGYERLDDAEAQLGKLGDAEDTSRLNSVFRLFHSVKGSAGYLGFEAIKGLTHEAEALLEVFLKEKIATTAESLDVIFSTIDTLRSLIRIVEKEYSDGSGAEAAAAQTARISECIASLRSGAAASAAKAAAENRIVLSELVSRDMVERFIAECSDLAEGAERLALGLEKSPDKAEAVNGIFRSIHTMKGNSGFFGYSYLEGLCMDFEALLDGARKGSVPLGEGFANSIIARIDALRSAMGALRIVDAREAAREGAGGAAPAERAAADEPRAASQADYQPLGEILVDMGAVREEEVQGALDIQERPLGEILVEEGSIDPGDLAKALEVQKAQAGISERAPIEEIQRKEIRVDTAKLDKLFDLVGELITAEAIVLNSSDLAGLKLDNFSKSFAGLNKISREIQETTMMIRMIPLESLFQKMTRLVRDLSRKSGKPVDFRVTGQETEMDKNVIEQISDPLVHIIRNAIDHGLELPEKRAAAGKEPTGSIRLDARYEGSEIWISVKDDGAGLSRERILAKAVEKGMVKAEMAPAMADKDVWSLIFEPGFSTASAVTEVSGRGVGMDVVKKNLERIRGKVDIRTALGEGTEFILKIPLTMAIIEGITVRAGGNFYSIPLGDILEFFKVSPSQLTVAERGEVAVALRGSVMPLVKLGEVFKIMDAALDPEKGTIIVVHSGGHKACLLIDEVVGNQQIVVKSLSEFLGKVEGISGCSILGDGTVSFIIDTGKLLSLRLEA